jgi:hypothetical protein
VSWHPIATSCPRRYIATVRGYEPDLAAHWLSYDDFPGEEEVCDLNAR